MPAATPSSTRTSLAGLRGLGGALYATLAVAAAATIVQRAPRPP